MSHTTGRVIDIAPVEIGPDGSTPPTGPGVWEHTFVPQPPLMGGPLPRFVILNLSAMNIPPGSQVEVPLGYDTEVYTSASGSDVWTRPIDPANPVVVRFVGGPAGSVTLARYGSGEPFFSDYPPGEEWNESTTNCDVFLHTDPYDEPTYQTWLLCGGSANWQNVAQASPGSVEEQTARAVGMFVHAGHDHTGMGGPDSLSTCTGTLIDTNLFLTARHCAQDHDELDIRSGSVTFDFQTDQLGAKPNTYNPHFYKVRRVAAAGGTWETWDDDATNRDWLILELEQVPVGVAPRPMRGTAIMANETVFTVHHPNGAVKKFQTGTLPSGDVRDVDNFDYAGGSSGSALFDANGHVIGAALSGAAGGPNVCQVAYLPAAVTLQALANPAVPPVPFDVMLVMDRSGSMGQTGVSGMTKMAEAIEAATLFVQLCRTNAGDTMGMVSFSTAASSPVDEPPGNVNNGQKNQLVAALGDLMADGSTSIGGGIQAAMAELPAGANTRAIVLMTDGMQNTWPMIADAEPSLGDTAVHAIGFGTEAQLDGPLLNALAHRHGGMYTRAQDGLALKKFFALCFGNIFEAGMLADPTLVLDAGVEEMTAAEFAVCDEERVTAVVGWERPEQRLVAELLTPGGATIPLGAAGTESATGMTWLFVKVPLPYAGEREGTWKLRVRRAGQPVPGIAAVESPVTAPSREAIRYVVSVLADGGPRLVPVLPRRRLYTGDAFNPRVSLHYSNGTAPHHTEVYVDVERLDGSLGALVAEKGPAKPVLGEEPVAAFAATLQKAEADNGGTLPIPLVTQRVTLYDDVVHDDMGTMEPDGVWGHRQADLLRHEGTYTFRAVATYGHDCEGRREAFWSLHVLPGIDADRSDVEEAEGGIRIRPRDRYGNPLGPGRGDTFDVAGAPGTTTGTVVDNGDGTYTVPVTTSGGAAPGVVVTQPEREPVVLVPGGWPGPGDGGEPDGRTGCLLWLVVVLAVLAAILAIVLVLD